ncbi:MAG: N-acetylglutaminylglutamine amidotransferase [Gammaproteobacteria bacterium]|nr:MAG: N-acetylglutaminylglutamine amidotransferase [Gammaproteobacteria bacterium]
MCGICGELRLDGERASRQVILRMNKHLVHRGPDNEGVYEDGPVALGHRRLSIIDLSERANQPLVDEQHELALVFNGTIYNYRELRETLMQRGHQFVTSGDSEVILKAWAEWGKDCVEHLTGMFAFAIWDKKQQILFLARDRLGIKPLYYSATSGRLRFASSIPALLAAGDVDTSIDSVALHHQFTLHGVVPAPMTIVKGVRKLNPGFVMLVKQNQSPMLIPYWGLDARRLRSERTAEEWIEVIHDELGRAVQRRMLAADVPVGVLLSGGLDSSLLVAMLAEQGQENLKTFSIGFEDQPEESGSEFEYSDQVVERYQTDHHKILIPNTHVIDRLPEAVGQMAEPMFAQDAIGFYLLAEQVSRSVKVVQSGQGADEVFAGYFWYQTMKESKGNLLRRFAPYYFDRDHGEYLQMVSAEFRGEDYTSKLIRHHLEKPLADEYIDQVLRMDVTMLITDDPVKRVDNMTMAWGLEARVPFLDHELVELAASMPPTMKLLSGGKHVLKQIARGRLPDDVIDRKKGYFPVPALKYVRGDFLEFMKDILSSKACVDRGIFERSYIEMLLKSPEEHLTRIQGSKLWHLAVFELWMQQVVDF